MGELNDLMVLPDDFSGRVRLFPLPNLVLFPGVMQPLHIFEPRYRAMLEAALASDGLIAMSVLLDGWQQDYEGRPPMSPIASMMIDRNSTVSVCSGFFASSFRMTDSRPTGTPVTNCDGRGGHSCTCL